MTIQNSTDLYGPAIYIVDPTAGSGTHTTLGAAITTANSTSNATIFLRPGTYSTAGTISAPMTITAWAGDGAEGNVIITAGITVSAAITVNISNVQLQTNSANILTVSGSAATIVNLVGCYINCTNNTGISYSSSSSSSQINLYNCTGNLGTTGIAWHTMSSTGTLLYQNCYMTNNGSSVTAANNSAGTVSLYNSIMGGVFSTSSTGTIFGKYSSINFGAVNAVAVNHGGSVSANLTYCELNGGTSAAINVGGGATLVAPYTVLVSSNAGGVVTGTGTYQYGISHCLNNATIAAGITQNTTDKNVVNNLQWGNASGTTGSATSNLMTIYEDGTYTPTLVGGTTPGTTTYTAQNGYYRRIGNQVTAMFHIAISAATGTGNAQMGGLPFTTANNSNGFALGAGNLVNVTWPASRTMYSWQLDVNGTGGQPQGQGSGVAVSIVQIASATQTFRGVVTYFV